MIKLCHLLGGEERCLACSSISGVVTLLCFSNCGRILLASSDPSEACRLMPGGRPDIDLRVFGLAITKSCYSI